MVSIPMLSKDRPIGGIWLAFEGERLFDAEDRALMLNIAQQSAQALERARLHDDKMAERSTAASSLQALQVSEAKFRRLIESNVIGVIFGEGDLITGANRRFLETIGYPYEDMLACKLRWPTITPPEFLQLDEHAVGELRERGSFTPYEKALLRKDGSRVPVLIGGAALQPGTWVCFVVDLTEDRRLQEQLLRTQKLESLSVLAGGMAHDFNNLLTCVIGNASLAREMAPPGEIQSILDTVVRSGLQASHLTRQMLAYAGRGRVHIRPIELGTLVREMRPLLRAAIAEGITLEIEGGFGPSRILADSSQIEQLVMNLAVNAAEAIPSGQGGAIRVTIEDERLDGEYVRDRLAGEIAAGAYVLLRVQDNGIGMDEETKRKIFDPFFTTKFTGRGLGLAAVSGIVRAHGGTIRVMSRPGAGSTFTIFLPAAGELLTAPSARTDVRGTGTILVVDDEGVVRQTARTALEHYGYTVLVAENGGEALEIFRRAATGVSLVLLDLQMPVMGGDETYRSLKSLHPDARVIVSSACDEDEARRQLGGDSIVFLQKPYTAMQLAQKVKAVLEGDEAGES
jgi:PAS domain S-box-containing protein